MQIDTLEKPVARRNHRPKASFEKALKVNPDHSPLHSERQDMLALLLSQGKEILCVLDKKAYCHSISHNWEFVSGCDAADDKGQGLKERIAPDHLHKVLGCLAAGPGNASAARFQVKHRDGHWRWCEMRVVDTRPTPDATHCVCLLRDVTDQIAAQGKLAKARLEADLAIRSRSEFLANMSHELRTPLNAILGFAQIIDGGLYGDIGHPKYHDYIGNIQESGNTLLSKINDLLEIATIDSGCMELRESPTDLVQLLRHAVEFHSHRAFAAQVTLRDQLPCRPVMVMVDRIRMLQVITNLLSNAIKYNRSGGAVDISCAARRDGGVDILIRDNGGGIPAGHLQNIIEAFGQDNSFFARSRDCVGLGLALSKEIVKLHQGRIHIESEAGIGTLLAVSLPKERLIKTPAAAITVEKAAAAAVS